ncbi:hypothetical protein ACFL30_04560, partial [Candidatus Latescibacterota bacterium]
IALCDCLISDKTGLTAEKETHCVTSNIYRKLGEMVEDAFDSFTLLDLSEENVKDTYAGTCK